MTGADRRSDWIRRARLYPIVDVDVAARHGWKPTELARRFLAAGATLLQLRAKSLPGRNLLALADAIVGDAHRVGARVIINDRADVAALAGADGVHVGQDDLDPVAVRRIVGPKVMVGWSTHTVEQIDAALAWPIDYLAVGPIFGTTSKDTGYTAVGLDLVRAAAARCDGLPLVAIGGITLDRARPVIDAGAAAVAVISDLIAAPDPADRVAAYLAALTQKDDP